MAAVGQQTLARSVDSARLYERHYPRVFSYCLWRLGKREDAEDAAQTTFLNAHRALGRGTTPASESSWLLTIAHNVCLARWRSQKSRPSELPAEPEALAALAAPEHDSQLLGRLQAALSGLPEVQRHAFVLREWQGLSYAEIAAQLETTETAVAALVFRARRSLMDALSDERAPSRLVGGLNVGSLLGWLKSLLGGTAAKLVVAGAVVGAAGIAAGVPLVQHHKPATEPVVVAATPKPTVEVRRSAPTNVTRTHSRTSGSTAAAPRRTGVTRTKAPTPSAAGSAPTSQAPSSASSPPSGSVPSPRTATSPGGSAPISIPVPSPPDVSGTVSGVVGTVEQLVPQVPTIAPPTLPSTPSLPAVPHIGP
jgi:RNA polymerase sigma-70 factor (ECF subfamily)